MNKLYHNVEYNRDVNNNIQYVQIADLNSQVNDLRGKL